MSPQVSSSSSYWPCPRPTKPPGDALGWAFCWSVADLWLGVAKWKDVRGRTGATALRSRWGLMPDVPMLRRGMWSGFTMLLWVGGLFAFGGAALPEQCGETTPQTSRFHWRKCLVCVLPSQGHCSKGGPKWHIPLVQGCRSFVLLLHMCAASKLASEQDAIRRCLQ